MNCSQKVVALTLFLPRNTPRCARNVFSYKAVFLPERNTALEGISKYCAILIKARKHLMFRGIRTSSLWSLNFLAPTRFIWLKLNLKRIKYRSFCFVIFFHIFEWHVLSLLHVGSYNFDWIFQFSRWSFFFSKENIKRSRWRMQ